MGKNKDKYNRSLFEKLWRKLHNKPNVKCTLFYYSLFDYEGFEEPGTSRNVMIAKDYHGKMISEIKKYFPNFFKSISEDTFRKAVATDFFTRDIISFELKKRGYGVNPTGPKDLLFNDHSNIEIKRFTTTKQMSQELQNINDEEDGRDLLLLFFFPIISDENFYRVEELVKGYYSLEAYFAPLEICVCDEKNFKEVLDKIENKLNMVGGT